MSNEANASEYKVALRWRDLDNQGHVYHGTYLTLLDEARTAFLKDLGFTNPGSYVLARIEIDYLHELGIDPPEVHAAFRIARVGNTSLKLSEEIISQGSVRARCQAVVVLWDAEKRESRELTPQERTNIQALQLSMGATA